MANTKKKTDYKSAVLGYLKDNIGEDVSRTELINNVGISKSRLTEILQSIKEDGYEIASPPRSGIVRLKANSDLQVIPRIKDSDIRQWLILFLLSKYEELTFNELIEKSLLLIDSAYEQSKILIDANTQQKAYDDTHLIKAIRKNSLYNDDDEIFVAKDIFSVTSLRKDLATLRKQKLVKMEQSTHTTYSLTTAAPFIIPLSNDSLYELCARYDESATSTTNVGPLKSAITKIQKIVNYEGNDIELSRYGKINEISPEMLNAFSSFIRHPYKTNLLQFESDFNEFYNVETFAVGLLFYSVETNNFYVLGKNISNDKIQSRRIDWINKITVLDEKNSEFHNPTYYDIYNEMFSSAYQDDVYRVKVLFASFGNVYKRFSDLHNVRKNSLIREIENPPKDCPYEYIYEDTIRGLSDFQRYLRTFGVSVLAIEPIELRDKMIATYNRVVEKSEEYHE